MKKNILLFIVLPLLALSQANLTWQSSFDLGSRRLRQDFFLAFYQGKFLDSTLKQKTLKQLGPANSIGLQEFTQINIDFFSHDTATWFLTFSQQAVASLQFNKNVFELVFFGNKNLEDSTFSLNPTSYYYSHLLTLGGGKYFQRGQFSWKIGGLISGIFSHMEGDFSRSKLAFSKNFDTITAQIFMKTENPLSSSPIKGIGVGINASIQWQIKQEKAIISIYNLGPAWLFKQHITTYTDTSLKLYGLTIDDLKAFSNQKDSLPSSFDEIITIKRDTAPTWKLLPFHVRGLIEENYDKHLFRVQMFYAFIPAFLPEITLAYYWHPKPWLWAGPSIKYGGFNGFTLGAVSQFIFNDRWSIELNFPALSQSILPSSYVGYNAFLKLKYLWKKS